MSIKSGKFFLSAVPTLLMLVLIFILPGNGSASRVTDELAVKVASFGLGMNSYIIGSKLTPTQKNTAAANMARDSYEGTYKFQDGELFVVVSREDDTVLAIYQRNEEADPTEAKLMISGLMGAFAEPTTMAHDKIIYWAYNNQGKIPEDVYNMSRQAGENLNILATVKFNSSFEITAEDTEQEVTGPIYFIITSNPLIQKFVDQE